MIGKLLVLGGSRFVGRAVVEAGVARGWDVTAANLGGWSHPAARQVVVDRSRADGLRPLTHGRWDAVVDTWAGDPDAVRRAVDALGGRAEHWTYVSSMSVYAAPRGVSLTEDTPVAGSGELRGYASRKRHAEEILEAEPGLMIHIVRPGVILGPHEYPGRLAWWLRRLDRGGRVLVPGPPRRQFQFVDASDLAAWVLLAAEQKVRGATNVTCPPDRLTVAGFLATCARAVGSTAEFVWVDPDWLRAAGVAPWTAVPLWVDAVMTPDVYDVDVGRATSLGATFRDAAETVRDTWAWLLAGGDREIEERLWLDPAEEARILRTWLSGREQAPPYPGP